MLNNQMFSCRKKFLLTDPSSRKLSPPPRAHKEAPGRLVRQRKPQFLWQRQQGKAGKQA